MKEIKLGQQGKKKGEFVTLVDDEDYEYLNQFRWSVLIGVSTNYAKRTDHRNSVEISMHRIIINAPNGLGVDHIDHNGLNNQKSNLRICSKSQNAMNKIPYGKSKYLGVSFYSPDKYNYITAAISINGRNVRLGYFKTEEEAALAYNEAAKKYHGEFANLNIIENH